MPTASENALLKILEGLSEGDKSFLYRHLLRSGVTENLGYLLLRGRTNYYTNSYSKMSEIYIADIRYFRAMTRWLSVKTPQDLFPIEEIKGSALVLEGDLETLEKYEDFLEWMNPEDLFLRRVRFVFGKEVCESLLAEWVLRNKAREGSLEILRKYLEEEDWEGSFVLEDLWDVGLEDLLSIESSTTATAWEVSPVQRLPLGEVRGDGSRVIGSLSDFGRSVQHNSPIRTRPSHVRAENGYVIYSDKVDLKLDGDDDDEGI